MSALQAIERRSDATMQAWAAVSHLRGVLAAENAPEAATVALMESALVDEAQQVQADFIAALCQKLES